MRCYGLFGGIYGIYECKFVYFVCCENSKQWFSSVKSKLVYTYVWKVQAFITMWKSKLCMVILDI